MYKGFSRSVRGASHEAKGIVCQDSSDHFIGNGYAAAVVADGHGSKKHFRSNVGSRLAVRAAVDAIRNYCDNDENFDELFPKNHKMIIPKMQKQVIANWNELINEHFEKNPVTEEEKSPFTPEEFENIPVESYYGTTLVAAVAGNGFTFGFQIGDGSLVGVFEDGETQMLIGYEESNPANITASMCNANAASMFGEYFISSKRIAALFVSTDGLYTSFGSDDDFLNYHTIIAGQLTDLDTFKDTIEKNLIKRSHFGTQDDISLSCVFDEDVIASNIERINKQIENNKKRRS